MLGGSVTYHSFIPTGYNLLRFALPPQLFLQLPLGSVPVVNSARFDIDHAYALPFGVVEPPFPTWSPDRTVTTTVPVPRFIPLPTVAITLSLFGVLEPMFRPISAI